MSANSSAVFPPLLDTVESPRPPILRLGSPFGLLTGIGGGRPASDESLSFCYWFIFLGEEELDEEESYGFFFAAINTYISDISSAVLPPLFATVERPSPPILRDGNPFGLLTGIGGGKPASEESSLSELSDLDNFGLFLASINTYMSDISSAVFPPLLDTVESPRPPILRDGNPLGLLTGIGGGSPASESSLSELSDLDNLGLFLASLKTYISAISSAVFPPLLARVDNPKPPILRPGSPLGLLTGIGGGRPASEESLSDSYFGCLFAEIRACKSAICSAVLLPFLARVERPSPPILRTGRAIAGLFGVIGGGRPASESLVIDLDVSLFGLLFLALFKTIKSAISSAVLLPFLARVERPSPPILRFGKATGFLTGMGGGKPASESVSDGGG